MLKYLTKFAMDILPSVAATIIGAYIVNHYIVDQARRGRPRPPTFDAARRPPAANPPTSPPRSPSLP